MGVNLDLLEPFSYFKVNQFEDKTETPEVNRVDKDATKNVTDQIFIFEACVLLLDFSVRGFFILGQ